MIEDLITTIDTVRSKDKLTVLNNGKLYLPYNFDKEITSEIVESFELGNFFPLLKDIGPECTGVYGLYKNRELVYAGRASKTKEDSKQTLYNRLNVHYGTIRGRRYISIEEMEFKYLTFNSEWIVPAAEIALINHYKPKWNGTGFGTGKRSSGRPGTGKIVLWESWFPLIEEPQIVLPS